MLEFVTDLRRFSLRIFSNMAYSAISSMDYSQFYSQFWCPLDSTATRLCRNHAADYVNAGSDGTVASNCSCSTLTSSA